MENNYFNRNLINPELNKLNILKNYLIIQKQYNFNFIFISLIILIITKHLLADLVPRIFMIFSIFIVNNRY
jgi:hypothetical protein